MDWSNKLRLIIILSTIEAKYHALSKAAKDTYYLHILLKELYLCSKSPVQFYSNNQSCIKLIDNHVLHSQTKHIKIQHHFILKRQARDIIIPFVPNKLQHTDCLTKGQDQPQFYANMVELGLKSLSI